MVKLRLRTRLTTSFLVVSVAAGGGALWAALASRNVFVAAVLALLTAGAGASTILLIRMHATLQQTQQELSASKTLAAIGGTVQSISHDLRHPLTAIVANAELLCAPNLDGNEREELYREVRAAVDQMTDMIESLLEFSPRGCLCKTFGPIERSVMRAVSTVRARPEFQHVNISISCDDRCETAFDPGKVERALVNLLLNACEFATPNTGKVSIHLRETSSRIEIRVIDNGPGVAAQIKERLFEPFVSCGKRNGIGLGLAIVRKICEDHGGDACLESSAPGRTVFRLNFPIVKANVKVANCA